MRASSLSTKRREAARVALFKVGFDARHAGQPIEPAMREAVKRLCDRRRRGASVHFRTGERHAFDRFVEYGEKILGGRRAHGAAALLENALAFPFDPRTGHGVGIGAKRIARLLYDEKGADAGRDVQKRLDATRSLRPDRPGYRASGASGKGRVKFVPSAKTTLVRSS